MLGVSGAPPAPPEPPPLDVDEELVAAPLLPPAPELELVLLEELPLELVEEAAPPVPPPPEPPLPPVPPVPPPDELVEVLDDDVEPLDVLLELEDEPPHVPLQGRPAAHTAHPTDAEDQ